MLKKILYKFLEIILIILALLFLILTVASIFDSEIPVPVFLVPLVLCILGIVLLEKKYRSLANISNDNNEKVGIELNAPDEKPTAPSESTDVPKKKVSQPDIIASDDNYLRYYYHYVRIAIISKDDSIFHNISIGDDVELRQEPTNEYDKEAVAVYVNGVKRGYIHKGTLQKMCNKWITHKDIYVKSMVTDIDVELKEIYIYLAFYDVLSPERYENKFKITVSSEKFYGVNEHEPLSIYYDYTKEKYLIEDWGTVPKSATDFFESIDGDIDYTSFVNDVNENESGSYSLTIVTVFTKSSYDK